MFCVYVLYSAKLKKRYIGSTQNIVKRLKHHNLGLDRWSQRGIPWVLIYQENFLTRSEAVIREKYFKTGHGRGELQRLI
jgi:putative endonuclease